MSPRTLLWISGAAAAALFAYGAREAGAKIAAAAEPARWTTAYRPGEVDPGGRRMGGTELRALVPFGGKLYAGLGYWEDTAADSPGAQVIALDGPRGTWRVDLALDEVQPRGPHAGGRRYAAIGALEAITLTTDAKGAPLAAPVHLLAAGPWSHAGAVDVFVRGEKRDWLRATLGHVRGNVRSFSQHVDRVTGVSRAFAGAAPLGIVSGTYEPGTESIAWDAAPEAWLRRGDRDDTPSSNWRVMGFAECDGRLFATIGPALYERHDGPSPAWERVSTASFPPGFNMKGNGGLRGIAAIPRRDGPGEVLVIAAGGPEARVIRVDPDHGFSTAVEQDVITLLSTVWHTPISSALLAYNHMESVVDPATGEPVLLIGLQAKLSTRAEAPGPTWSRRPAGATYLLRHADGRYEVRAMEDPTLRTPPPRVAVRTMALSPWDPGVLYAGGFDANRQPVHDTAWALRAPLTIVLGSPD